MWRLDTMHAGVPGSGADDAWYHTSLLLEDCYIQDEAAIGGSVDIFKCFDQIVRLLEQARIYFSFAGHIGTPHRHRCGIPQGCPFSML
eukprot:1944423-Karenia_brevis.AAC.1